MKCPIDGSDLVMSERQGIEIDYCPQCRGVWLDRGELDKIIERSASQAEQPQPPPRAPYPEQERRYSGDHDRRDERHYGRKPYRKRKSFLDDIFDF